MKLVKNLADSHEKQEAEIISSESEQVKVSAQFICYKFWAVNVPRHRFLVSLSVGDQLKVFAWTICGNESEHP